MGTNRCVQIEKGEEIHMIRITVWNEYKHEREYEDIRQVYPEGIHACIASFLEKEEDFTVHMATFDMPEPVSYTHLTLPTKA